MSLCLSGIFTTPVYPQEAASRKPVVIFEDNFDKDGIPDPAKWTLCQRSHPQWCKYMSGSYDRAYVKDGNLVLVAEKVGDTYKTGGVDMNADLAFTFGKVEVRARFTVMAQGCWPAIWMMPVSPVYGGWPASGEIDIMEHLNFDPFIFSTVHSNYTLNLGHTKDPVSSTRHAIDASEYNVYGVEWTDEAITFTCNGQKFFTYPNLHLPNEDVVRQWPFNSPYYIKLSNQLGGPDTWAGPIDDSQLPAIMEIDWVRVTAL